MRQREITNISEYGRGLFENDFKIDNPYQRVLQLRMFGRVLDETKILVHNESITKEVPLSTFFEKSKKINPPKITRHIQNDPIHLMEASGVIDDYYLNLIDWGNNGRIAVALDETIFFWDRLVDQHGSEIVLQDDINSISWNDNCDIIAIGTSKCNLHLYDYEINGVNQIIREVHNSRISTITWNQNLLTSGSKSGDIAHVDIRTNKKTIARVHKGEICSLSWSKNNVQLASGGNDDLIKIYDYRKLVTPLFVLTGHKSAIKALSWTPWENNLLITGGGKSDKNIKFWNTQNGTCIKTIQTSAQITGICCSLVDKEFSTSHGYGDVESSHQISIWDCNKTNPIKTLKFHTERILNTRLSPNGEYICTLGADEMIAIWKVFNKIPPKKYITEPFIQEIR